MTKAKLRKVVTDLGSTPDEIASFLEGQGITGIRHYEEVCPMAKYLHAVFGTRASVDLHHISVCNSGNPVITEGRFRGIGITVIKTPVVARDFITRFDAGKCKKLIQKVGE